MTITTRPAPARTDAVAESARTGTAARTVRRAGIAVAAGSLTWAAGLFAAGANPPDSLGMTITDLTAVPFQLGLFALLTAQLRTGATGFTRAARAMIKVEYVLLGLATLWSFLHGAFPALRDDLWLAVLDVFWPLSMLGMAVIGVKIAFVGRWRGAARVWPLIAESWAVVTVPSFIIFGQGVVDIVGPTHLLVGYVGLGVLLALRPRLAARD